MQPLALVEADTLGEGWLAVCRLILAHGGDASWDGAATREVPRLTLVVERPDPDDETIRELGDAEWSAWMARNFRELADVAELGDARSYAARLQDYGAAGRDQVAWVVERLRADRSCRDAAITTFEPLADASYVPCVSLLDFWIPEGRLELVVYAHSLDFGKKAYGNLVELAALQQRVAGELEVEVGRLVVHAKSAHVYEPEWDAMRSLTTRS
jgi:thymidylate synthase